MRIREALEKRRSLHDCQNRDEITHGHRNRLTLAETKMRPMVIKTPSLYTLLWLVLQPRLSSQDAR
ncbi:MAG: hypothetical protein P1U77_26120 [Rubripirellula sp.]|nr:hypothetical protein [Planctomycetaceae bacterium]MDF1844905.1 hypothetical protein [Rubripirellula sp.]